MKSIYFAAAMLALAPAAIADTIQFADGRTLTGAYVRDEGIRYLVWERFEDVGKPPKVYGRSEVKSVKVERDEAWDAHPNLPDLAVTFIEMNPKLAGLHGRVDYDNLGRPVLKGGSLPDLGEIAAAEPRAVVRDLKLEYKPGDEITLTAHVKNSGFRTAQPFNVLWLIDGQPYKRQKYGRGLREMEEATFTQNWKWQAGEHHVTVRIESRQPEISSINNEATDPLWGWGFYYVVHPGRVQAWHQARTAYGTFSFEDFYRWHIGIMNTLFAASKWPSAPDGIRARVRLDRIIYTEDIDATLSGLVGPDGIGYHQGGWTWRDEDDQKRTWKPATKEWRNQTEWSLPHELGHQLGLTDLYNLDEAGSDTHKWPDNGEKITHFMRHPNQMMHWHGPHVFGEVDAGYLNASWDKPRGYFGDYHFQMPREIFLRVVDVNGLAVPNAQVEVFQRGVVVDPNGTPGEEQGVRYAAVVEDGDFGKPVSATPVITGTTDAQGLIRLPNRPVAEVKTLNGYHRQPNPFGNINVVGNRGLMLAKVTKDGRTAPFWLEITEFNTAALRGHTGQYTTVLKTPFGSTQSPMSPRAVQAKAGNAGAVTVSWEAPETPRETNYLDKPIGYRVYRRIGGDGLNDRPWFPVATLGPEARSAEVNLTQFPADTYWFSKTNRFAVTSIGELGVESGFVEVVGPAPS